jgi:hypothetical protein
MLFWDFGVPIVPSANMEERPLGNSIPNFEYRIVKLNSTIVTYAFSSYQYFWILYTAHYTVIIYIFLESICFILSN